MTERSDQLTKLYEKCVSYLGPIWGPVFPLFMDISCLGPTRLYAWAEALRHTQLAHPGDGHKLDNLDPTTLSKWNRLLRDDKERLKRDAQRKKIEATQGFYFTVACYPLTIKGESTEILHGTLIAVFEYKTETLLHNFIRQNASVLTIEFAVAEARNRVREKVRRDHASHPWPPDTISFPISSFGSVEAKLYASIGKLIQRPDNTAGTTSGKDKERVSGEQRRGRFTPRAWRQDNYERSSAIVPQHHLNLSHNKFFKELVNAASELRQYFKGQKSPPFGFGKPSWRIMGRARKAHADAPPNS